MMLQLFSDTHCRDRLATCLRQRLERSGQPRTHSGLLNPTRASSSLAGARWRTALHNWRVHGFSLIWLAQRLPGLRTLYRLYQFLRQLRPRLNAMTLAIEQHRQRLAQLEHSTERARLVVSDVARIERILARLPASEASGAPRPAAPALAPDLAPDLAWYLDFEQTHRGEHALLRQRLSHYLPFVGQAIPDPQAGILLDLGCGRGDWLALLREHGFVAEGVELDRATVLAAREAGLLVHQDDAVSALVARPDNSLAAVTAFQLVEHLPLEGLLELMRQVQRTLRPGGLLILETPNPENLQVSGYSFWMDPTHRQPLPPPLLFHLAKRCGLIDLHIERRNPWPQWTPPAPPADEDAPEPGSDRALLIELRRLLYCEQDYALIARKPLGTDPFTETPVARLADEPAAKTAP